MKRILELVAVAALITYVYGFLVWNIFLAKFGFFEYGVLQTRFVSAGVVFMLSYLHLLSVWVIGPILVFLILNSFLHPSSDKQIKQKVIAVFKNKEAKILFLTYFLLVAIFYVGFYSSHRFLAIPQSLGGGQPFYISIIADPDVIDYLGDFGLSPTENSEGKRSVQTEITCGIYQNSQIIMVGITDATELEEEILYGNNRVLILEKKLINGIHVTSQKLIPDFIKSDCKALLERIF